MNDKRRYETPSFEVVILEDGNVTATNPDNGSIDMLVNEQCLGCDVVHPAQN